MSSAPIVLTTLNARYFHSAFGLRYLKANLEELEKKSRIVEFTINQNPRDIAEAILALEPEIVGFGIYIWNTRQSHDVISILRRLRPELRIVLGGPEVSYEAQNQPICALADAVVQGEGEDLFRELSRGWLESRSWPAKKWITGALPEVKTLKLPYRLYTDEDVRHRVLYVEASRGCPYKCEYCLSSLDKSVRSFDLDLFLAEMSQLIDRGARQFKFVDRTFNLSVATSTRILSFFLERISLGLFLHFEMVPDRLPEELRELIRKFPPGSLQFEVGIQTWNPEVAKLVSRRQDYSRIRENFAFLNQETGVHTHADLIAGLPGETLDSFADGFDAVAELAPDEIQVGILKRLKGTPIIRHDQEWAMVYQEHPPFQILQTRTMSFSTLQGIGRFSHFWDLVANSGNFVETLKLLRERSRQRIKPSLYREFEALSQFLSARHPQGHGVALLNLVESVWIWLTQVAGIEADQARAALTQDYTGKVKRDVPRFLRTAGTADDRVENMNEPSSSGHATHPTATPRRQRKHLNATSITS